LRAFAATPGEIAEEVLPADAVGAGLVIDSRLAAFDQAGQIVHSILRFSILLEPIRHVRDDAIYVKKPHRLPVAEVAADP
jgi:hypothetical protein